MAAIPSAIAHFPRVGTQVGSLSMHDYLVSRHGQRVHRGKVRDTYAITAFPDYLLVVATDRISVMDFVLPVLVSGKGEILTALTHFWLTHPLRTIPNHLVKGQSAELRKVLGEGFPLKQTLLVRKLAMFPFELIYRAHIGGSVWEEYQKEGTAAGQPLPIGLRKWSKLQVPIFTPSTKSESGHDVNLTVARYLREGGTQAKRLSSIGSRAMTRGYNYALSNGVVILDTKFEVGIDGTLGDEVLTPDSSRMTTIQDLQEALEEGRDPIFYDKEPVRKWGRQVETPFGVIGLQNLDPENPDHVAFVHSLSIPENLVEQTRRRYHQLFELLVGMPLHEYQNGVMRTTA